MTGSPELLARIEALEARVRAAEDVLAIQNLKSRYGALADARYDRNGVRPSEELARIADQIAALFTEDATWDGGAGLGVCRGRDEIRKRFLEPTLRFSWHYFVKPHITVEDDEARATWDILAPCTTRDGRAHWMSGAEDDTYRRVDGAWLHASMTLRLVFMAPHDAGWAKPRSRG